MPRNLINPAMTSLIAIIVVFSTVVDVSQGWKRGKNKLFLHSPVSGAHGPGRKTLTDRNEPKDNVRSGKPRILSRKLNKILAKEIKFSPEFSP